MRHCSVRFVSKPVNVTDRPRGRTTIMWQRTKPQGVRSAMEQIDVEVLVIGWGKGGKTLAAALGRAGRKVAVIERSRMMYGGGCINVACVPTKDLVHSAELRRADDSPQAWF